MRNFLVITSVVLSAVVAVLAFLTPGRSHSGTAHTYISSPMSLDEMVEFSDVIFLGTIVNIIDGGMFSFGPVEPTKTPNANAPDPYLEMLGDQSHELQMALIGIHVDQVYFSRPPITLLASTVITMSRGADLSGNYATPTAAISNTIYGDGWEHFRMTGPLIGAVGDQKLFFLKKESAPSMSGLFGPSWAAYSVLDVSGQEVTISTNPPISIDITDNSDTVGFFQELEAIIQQQ